MALGACAALLLLASAVALPPAPPSLPTLSWEVRSDWQLVTAFGAAGDGKKDDTAALQAALDFVGASGQGDAANKTLFFPAGTYLITSTLILNHTSGVLLLGTGATTVLLWGGGSAPAPPPDGGQNRLLWSCGNTRFQIEGFLFDSGGLGEVGLDHDSHSGYESRVVHRNLAFHRWQTAGIRVGHRQSADNGVASAEMTFVNCVFWFNYAGVMLLAWNGALTAPPPTAARVLSACALTPTYPPTPPPPPHRSSLPPPPLPPPPLPQITTITSAAVTSRTTWALALRCRRAIST